MQVLRPILGLLIAAGVLFFGFFAFVAVAVVGLIVLIIQALRGNLRRKTNPAGPHGDVRKHKRADEAGVIDIEATEAPVDRLQ